MTFGAATRVNHFKNSGRLRGLANIGRKLENVGAELVNNKQTVGQTHDDKQQAAAASLFSLAAQTQSI